MFEVITTDIRKMVISSMIVLITSLSLGVVEVETQTKGTIIRINRFNKQ